MKTGIAVLALALSSSAFAQSHSPLETVDQARQRQSAENYEAARNRDNQLLPPSYSRPLGDVEQRGVERPGYASPGPGYQPAPIHQPQIQSGSGDWRRGLR